MVAWTEDLDDRARRLWAKGSSASEIATEIGLGSRHAVIGRAWRQKWPRAAVLKLPAQPEEKPMPMPVPSAPVAEPAIEIEPPVTILNVTASQCRFPLTDRWPWPMCGAPVQRNSSYCADHHRRCFIRGRW
jgi:GcrA cell cycle regulator